MDTPNVPINFVPAKTGETFNAGTITIRIMEDGSRTGELGSQSALGGRMFFDRGDNFANANGGVDSE